MAPPRGSCASPVAQITGDHAEQHADDGFAQVVAPGQQVPGLRGQAQHPLPNRDVGKHLVHEVRGALGHPPPATARAEASPLTGKRNQSIQPAAAPEAGESPSEPPTPEERLEFLLDETRQALAVAQVSRLRPERLEVLAHDLIQHAPARIARRVLDRRQGHDANGGERRATERSGRFPRPSATADLRDGRFGVQRVRHGWQFERTEPGGTDAVPPRNLHPFFRLSKRFISGSRKGSPTCRNRQSMPSEKNRSRNAALR